MKLINGPPVHYFFYPGFLAREFFFWDRPFPLLIFFSFRIYFLVLNLPQESNFWLTWDISVITCGSSFPILWDWDIKSKCSKLLFPLCWDCLPFQTLTMNYLSWATFTVHRSYTSLYHWFSAFHTLWLTEWTWEHLCFPGCRKLDEVTQPHLRARLGPCLPCSFHWHSDIQEWLRLVVWSEAGSTPGQLCVPAAEAHHCHQTWCSCRDTARQYY